MFTRSLLSFSFLWILSANAFAADYLVGFEDWSQRRVPEDFELLKVYSNMQLVSVRSSIRPVIPGAKFVARRAVLKKSKNTEITNKLSSDNSKFANDQSVTWGVEMIGAPEAWLLGATGKGVRVLVLDSGIDKNHPALKNKIIKAKDFTKFDLSEVIPYPEFDITGHGTHVAGTILGDGNNLKGVAPGADLFVGKVCIYACRNLDVIVDGLEWGIENKIDVVNMSFSSAVFAPKLGKHIFERLEFLNVVAVAAAGNDREKENHIIDFPANQPTALAVAAVDQNGQTGVFSNLGPELSIAAPGVGVLSADITRNLDKNPSLLTAKSGTSMAAPHVVGVVALVKEAAPHLTAKQIRELVVSTASKLDEPQTFVGAGLLDAYAAVEKAKSPYLK